ncbi:ADP-forming succinate--CoA ligase subunit beta [Haemophilus parahaemolyticus]|uniref:Succinate--CoA ligase [ADP-forming] subunit beta n=2 Tax=Haemophilus parahaemolyticus TaxID=735 RepID=A0AAE6JRW8_HAEPH|nr:ADP-forming succinate--CoA ligase subunit beta [Haemophilus parahaemolyticus]EIJ72495.1 succinate-CoA ligase, beta subunit [Haemophilus parahaemolyticus HK385]OOR97367.1 succinate--CoA ligase subunit beta [Haemophilus parahaemolyticus]QEN11540.1 ADP-forming succinate--CoA ligase subunit beta [Haemophilus parahaemolyticus]QRP12741.1 ADP-forming succinate--CoA ligase subunit beta [Haemophilus parahaemolyticus]STO66444.1 succinyl-CoA synthetase subunit beta [Haemophilus parahaemolyticus HK385]
MNLHEYQAKQLFSQYGLPINRGIACHSIEETEQALSQLNGNIFAVKCQIHAGGRGKAGGVKLVKNAEQARQFAEQWLGKRMVTFQTDSKGLPVNTIYVEETCEIERELYLGAVIGRSSQKVVFMASSAGGMEIEEIARNTPELIHKISLDPLTNAQPFQARELAFKLGLKGTEIKQFTAIFLNLAKLFLEKDLALLEVNPLVVTKQQNLICLDAKAVIDNNALYRHPELKALEDESQEDPREAYASQWELNYVALKGNIGCMVNGAGLAMGTMDMIKLQGGEPANFLDVGGGATKERVAEAFKLILSDSQVKAVLVNIFGGIVRCDLIAEGIISAVNEVGVNVPVVVRLEGTNAEQGRAILAKSRLNLTVAETLTQAAISAVNFANQA